MDGGWWADLGNTSRHLFVNESHNQISNAGIEPEWWFKHERPSKPNRSSTGSTDSRNRNELK